MSAVSIWTDAELCAAVGAECQTQNTVHSPMIQPLARVALASTLNTPPTGVDDPLWNSLPDLGGFFTHRPGDGLQRDVEARVAHDSQALYVRILNRHPPQRRSFKKEFWCCDTNEIFIDPLNDHFNYLQFAIMPDGTRKSVKGWKSCGTQRWENRGKMEPLSTEAWSGTVQVTPQHWATLFTVPFQALGLKPQPGQPLGFNLLRQRCGTPWDWRYWNFTHRGSQSPFGFGDLYLSTPPRIHVEKVDLGELQLWENRGRAFLRNCSGEPISAKLHVSVKTGAQEEQTFHEHTASVQIPAQTPQAFQLPFVFPFDPREFKYQHLHLALKDSAGQQLWAGTFRSAYEHGQMLHLDDRREGPELENPRADDPEFVARKRAYIMRRLPKLLRKTTAQGAPSDFTLEAADRSISFDLMRAGVLKRIADYIYSRYDNDLDRLLGATFFAHQRAVVQYAHAPAALATCLGPLSVMRLGNAICSNQADVLCGILEKMTCEASGERYRTATVTFFAHVVTACEFNGKWVHLDGSLGRFYFLPGNRELATMEELIAQPELGRQQSANLEQMLRKTAQTDLPIYGGLNCGIWPPGAPAE